MKKGMGKEIGNELMQLVPQAHSRGLVGHLLKVKTLVTPQLPQTIKCWKTFSVEHLWKAQCESKAVPLDATSVCEEKGLGNH